MKSMNCISLHQPYGTLCIIEAKKHETRHWPTKVRGRILIHAAKRWTRDQQEMCEEWPFADYITGLDIVEMPLGAILGSIEIVDCISTNRIHPDSERVAGPEWHFGDFSKNRYAWKLENPIKFNRPIPWKGAQGFFNVPINTLQWDRTQLRTGLDCIVGEQVGNDAFMTTFLKDGSSCVVAKDALL